MGNRSSSVAQSTRAVTFQMTTIKTMHEMESVEEIEKQTVFKVFDVKSPEEASVITTPLDNVKTKEYNNLFQVAYSTKQLTNTRKMQGNEDEIYVKQTDLNGDSVFIASVLDGHQGRHAADFLLDSLFGSLASLLLKIPSDISTEIKRIFQEIDHEYCEEQGVYLRELLKPKQKCCFTSKKTIPIEREHSHIGCGCVLTLLCIHNNQLILIGLGDCGIVFSSHGRACHSLLRHNPDVEVEFDRIMSVGGRVINNRIDGNLAVSRSIGDVWFKKSYRDPTMKTNHKDDVVIAEPEVQLYQITQDLEFCIIASDGLFSFIPYQIAVNIVKECIMKGQTGEEACDELARKARLRTRDDISVIILFFNKTQNPVE